jgi:hypothetical protein
MSHNMSNELFVGSLSWNTTSDGSTLDGRTIRVNPANDRRDDNRRSNARW